MTIQRELGRWFSIHDDYFEPFEASEHTFPVIAVCPVCNEFTVQCMTDDKVRSNSDNVLIHGCAHCGIISVHSMRRSELVCWFVGSEHVRYLSNGLWKLYK